MRLEVTRKSNLAIRALVAMADAPGMVKTADLAVRLDAAPAFLAQVLTELTKIGLVASSPGPTGGYETLVDLGELSVADVIEALEGPTDDKRCVVADGLCEGDGSDYCSLHEAWTHARSVLLEHLRTTTLDRVAACSSSPVEISPTATSHPPKEASNER